MRRKTLFVGALLLAAPNYAAATGNDGYGMLDGWDGCSSSGAGSENTETFPVAPPAAPPGSSEDEAPDAGTAGAGGSGSSDAWPDCASNPGGEVRTIPQIWQDDPVTATPVWVRDVVVTGVVLGGCTGTYECLVFLQQDETYANWDEGAHHAIKLLASGETASHFADIREGDVVDVYAHALRDTTDGRNELLLLVDRQYPGCANVVGNADPQPIQNVTLDDLTVAAYEDTHGPLFVRVEDVTGTPRDRVYFGLWPNGQCCDGAEEDVTRLCAWLLPTWSFQGLTKGAQTEFDFVQGVFDVYEPAGSTRWRMLYPRYDDEYPSS